MHNPVWEENVFQYSASRYDTPVLNISPQLRNDVSYGVLLEIAKSVKAEKPIDLRMGNVNVIWQGDANEIAIRSLIIVQYLQKFSMLPALNFIRSLDSKRIRSAIR